MKLDGGGSADLAVARISVGRCPECPHEQIYDDTHHIDGIPVPVLRCPCCRAAWRVPVRGTWECLDLGGLAADPIVDTKQAAAVAGVGPRTLAKYLSDGRVPDPATKVGGSPIWSLPTLHDWLDRRPGQGARTDRQDHPPARPSHRRNA